MLKYSGLFVIALFALAGNNPLHADVIAYTRITGPTCTLSQTIADPTSASAGVACDHIGVYADVTFNAALPSLANLSFSDNVPPPSVGNSRDSLDSMLVVTGGTGTGFLALDYLNSVNGFKDAQASASASYQAYLNGSPTFGGIACQGPIAVTGPFSCSNSIPIGFTFTYGTPFEFRFDLSAVAGGGLGGATISGTGSFAYTILTNGQPNPNGKLSAVPEPSTFGICALPLAIALYRCIRRRSPANDL